MTMSLRAVGCYISLKVCLLLYYEHRQHHREPITEIPFVSRFDLMESFVSQCDIKESLITAQRCANPIWWSINEVDFCLPFIMSPQDALWKCSCQTSASTLLWKTVFIILGLGISQGFCFSHRFPYVLQHYVFLSWLICRHCYSQ